MSCAFGEWPALGPRIVACAGAASAASATTAARSERNAIRAAPGREAEEAAGPALVVLSGAKARAFYAAGSCEALGPEPFLREPHPVFVGDTWLPAQLRAGPGRG